MGARGDDLTEGLGVTWKGEGVCARGLCGGEVMKASFFLMY